MTQQIIVAEIKGDKLIITMPISGKASKSGKNILVASSGGNQPSTATYNGKPVTIGLNAYVPAS